MSIFWVISRVSRAQEAAAEVMATRATAITASAMHTTAQTFARVSAAADRPCWVWARRPAPGTTAMEGSS